MHSPVNVVRFATDPDVQCARLAGDSHLGEERKYEGEGEIERERENVRKENIQVCYMFHPSASAHRGTQSRDCDRDRESRGIEK